MKQYVQAVLVGISIPLSILPISAPKTSSADYDFKQGKLYPKGEEITPESNTRKAIKGAGLILSSIVTYKKGFEWCKRGRERISTILSARDVASAKQEYDEAYRAWDNSIKEEHVCDHKCIGQTAGICSYVHHKMRTQKAYLELVDDQHKRLWKKRFYSAGCFATGAVTLSFLGMGFKRLSS